MNNFIPTVLTCLLFLSSIGRSNAYNMGYSQWSQGTNATLKDIVTLSNSLRYISAPELKAVLLQAPIQEMICKLDAYTLVYFISSIPYTTIQSNDPEEVKKFICEDKKFYEKMKKIDDLTLKIMAQSVGNPDFFLQQMDSSLIEQLSNAVFKANLKQKAASTLDDPNTVFHLFANMPNIPYQLANSLVDAKCGFIAFIMDHNTNLEGLLTSMNAETLKRVLECYPKLGERMTQLSERALVHIIHKMDKLFAFLDTLDDKTADIFAMKVPRLAPLLKMRTPKTVVEFKSAQFDQYSTKNHAYLSSKFPEIEKFLRKMSRTQLNALEKRMPKVIKRIEETPAESLKGVKIIFKMLSKILDRQPLEEVIRTAERFFPVQWRRFSAMVLED